MRMGTGTLTWHFSLLTESSWAIQRGQRKVEGEEQVTRPHLPHLYIASSSLVIDEILCELHVESAP